MMSNNRNKFGIIAITMLCFSLSQAWATNKTLPDHMQLGMNNVPVLDQGWEWGDCANFAVTAALNAAHRLHDDNQISSVCYMQMTRSFVNDLDQSAWNDGDPLTTLLMYEHFGVMSVGQQKNMKIDGKPVCGGIAEYPFVSGQSDFEYSPPLDINNVDEYIKLEQAQRVKDGGAGEEIPTDKYISYSSHLINSKDWYVISHRIDKDPSQALEDIKSALVKGDRIVVAIKMDVGLEDHAKNMGALGKYHSQLGDTWVITDQILKDYDNKTDFPSHATIITGYDDNAVVSGQKGLLTVRNSVGAKMGDHGDFYITYDYFKKMMFPGFPVAVKSYI